MGRLKFSTLIKLNALSFICLFSILIFSLLSTAPLTEKRVVIQTINNGGISVKGKGSLAFQGLANPEDRVNIRLSFAPSNKSALASKIMAATIPGSKTFGQHLTKEEVNEMVAPDSQTLQTINSWLKSNGIPPSSRSSTRNHMELSLSVQEANDLFQTNIGVFNDSLTGESSVNAPNVSIPSTMLGFINVVIGRSGQGTLNGSHLPVTVPGGGLSAAAPCSNSSLIPVCLQSLYNIPSTPTPSPNNSIGILGFQPPKPSDVELFLNVYRPDLARSSFLYSVIPIGGNASTPSDDAEPDLDIEYIMALAPFVNATFFSVNSQTLDGFTEFIQFMLEDDDPPKVLSISYGFNEADIPKETALMLCDELMQLTALGVTIISATGDGGVAGGQSGQCSSFQVTFPSGCPWVTAVGATSGIPEIGANLTNGGFSEYFPLVSYQQVAVRKFLHKLGTENMGLFHNNGRGTPDIAVQGTNLPYVVGGDIKTGSGTSFSAPILAAIVANLNAELLAAGKSPVGFLNPTLYFMKDVTNDITNGSNPGCGTDGFSATTGWDPVTGLGTPNITGLSLVLAV